MRERFEQHVGERACKQGSEQASKHAAEKDEGKLKRLECWDPSLLAQKKSGFTVLPSSADADKEWYAYDVFAKKANLASRATYG